MRNCYAYWYPHNPAFGVLRTTDKDATEQQSHSAQQAAYSEKELCPTRNLDPQLRLWAHRFGVRFSIWQHKVAVRMLVEVHQRTILLLLRWRRHATGHSHSFWIEGILWDILDAGEGLPAAHDGELGRQGMVAFLRDLQKGE